MIPWGFSMVGVPAWELTARNVGPFHQAAFAARSCDYQE
jgi:hypothetical protein